jgi:RNA polymerase sigma-70 factor, ECF subfamily
VSGLSSSSPPPTRPPNDDAVLAMRAADGDIAAFGVLVERHRGVVYRLARRFVGVADAEDVTQDAFLRAFHRLRGFRHDAPFRSWLLRIAHNAALDHAAHRTAEPVDPAGFDAEAGAGGPRPPAERLEMRERIERLEHKLRLLTASHRTVLVLRDIEGLSYEEIAQVTDWPLGSVKGRLHRARREFVDLLRSNTYDWELPG